MSGDDTTGAGADGAPAAGRAADGEDVMANDVMTEDGIVDGDVVEEAAGGPDGAGEVAEAEEADPLSAAQAERDEYLDALRRLQAEFENYKKRVAKQQADQAARASLSQVEQLLPVLDALDLATGDDERAFRLKTAEIKHCRVAMLAVAGAIFQDIAQDPGYAKIVGGAKLTAAHDKIVSQGGMAQILLWVSFAEVFGTIALFETLEGKRAPGDFKFDPLGFGKQDMKTLQLKEIKNGRLAMLAIGGIVHHYFITGKGPIELLTNFKVGA